MTLVDAPRLERSTHARRGELMDDLRACWSPASPEGAGTWLSRPSIARRVASLITELIPAGTDRVLVDGPGAEALGMAVALDSGLPFALVGPPLTTASRAEGAGGPLFGVVHRGERVVVLRAVLGQEADPDARYERLGVTVEAVVGVVPTEDRVAHPADPSDREHLVFDALPRAGAGPRATRPPDTTPATTTTTEQPT